MSLTSAQQSLLQKLQQVFGSSDEFLGLEPPESATIDDTCHLSEANNISVFHQFWQSCEQLQNRNISRKLREAYKSVEDFGLLSRNLSTEVETLSSNMKSLQVLKSDVLRKTEQLHRKCEALMNETQLSHNIIKQLTSRLAVYDSLPATKQKLENVTGKDTSVNALELDDVMNEIDEAIEFFTRNFSYAEADANKTAFEDLRMQACTVIRQAVSQSLEVCTNSVASFIKNKDPGTIVSLEPSVYYVRYRTVGNTLKPLTSLLHTRVEADVSEVYANALHQLEGIYISRRICLLTQPFKMQLESILLKHKHNISLATRHSTTYVLSVAQLEFNTFTSFFHPRQEREAVKVLLAFLGDIYYELIRTAVLGCDSVDELKEIATCLSLDVLEPEKIAAGKMLDLAPLVSLIFKLHGDVQERLIFKTETYIRDEIRGFVPRLADLEYPYILRKYKAGDNQGDPTVGWYPTLTRTLTCLWVVFRILEVPTFQGIAQEAVGVCLKTLLDASKRIRDSNNNTLDYQLFLIKHLLILRGQVTVFEVDLIQQERLFDFAGVKQRLWDLVAKRSFTGLTSASGIFKYFAPVVQENKTDTRQDLEAALRQSCEALVAQCSALVVMPLLRLNANIINHVSQTESSSGLHPDESQPNLRDLPFLSTDALSKTFNDFYNALCIDLPYQIDLLRLYLSSDEKPYPSIPKYFADEFLHDVVTEKAVKLPTTVDLRRHEFDDSPSPDRHDRGSIGSSVGLYDPNDSVQILLRPIRLSIMEIVKQTDGILKRDIGFSNVDIDSMRWKEPAEVEFFFKVVLGEIGVELTRSSHFVSVHVEG